MQIMSKRRFKKPEKKEEENYTNDATRKADQNNKPYQ